ncbi:SPOR domain-containing protein [Pseudorhodobacter sp.]|uniref:SPOR domain-containing protein n=1 Tax=Pseudorhodobacter sp. TaxID=1934400 RepID=UPI0039E525FE
MADVKFETFDGGAAARDGVVGQTTRLFSMAGAVTSVALVLGMGYWGYSLAVRDMTGIPVVRAIEGPMRIAPEEPGGQIADHQGLSVNNIAAEGGISAPADTLVLAPAPINLSEDDMTGPPTAQDAEGSPLSVGVPGLASAAMTGLDAQRDGEEDSFDPLQTVDENTDMIALADALSTGVTPLSGDLDITLDLGPQTAPSLPKGALALSPRPRPRPAGQVTMVAVKVDAAEITGENLASGTRLVQLGAFDSEEIARKEWDRLSGKFADLLTGKTRIVQAASSGGRMFYRLRAMGFDTEADSRRFCSALVAERAACIPVAVR